MKKGFSFSAFPASNLQPQRRRGLISGIIHTAPTTKTPEGAEIRRLLLPRLLEEVLLLVNEPLQKSVINLSALQEACAILNQIIKVENVPVKFSSWLWQPPPPPPHPSAGAALAF